MSNFTKLSVQVPGPVKERFVDLDHGRKQLACTAGLIWYFNADEETQQLYRAWAQAIAEGYGTIDKPPDMLKPAIEKKAPAPTRPAKKTKK